MTPNLNMLMLLLAVTTVTVLAQKRRPASKPKVTTDEWNFRDGSDKVNMRGIANLTQTLDDWRFDILSQMRGLLQNDHQSVLPDYARIQPLSEALNDLYTEFNALKAHLGDLTEKFSAIETFIDEVKESRTTNTNADAGSTPSGGIVPVVPVVRQGGRRVIKKKPTTS
ncbi:uncharacterized protein si:ch211-76l23.4 [Gymnodraco acuticeps]|uniref:Uncharacterized protein si:ch211-76l23.4 n=1 Tax=Gymnodraco acuticeps TaxID=8218 RepID=A0A6P8VPG1_GYMAC|nr:uncharacterized protein si:ch211-76l23.4 [Gymnodraco acuticeps]